MMTCRKDNPDIAPLLSDDYDQRVKMARANLERALLAAKDDVDELNAYGAYGDEIKIDIVQSDADGETDGETDYPYG